MRRSRLSLHARQRVAERTSMTPAEILDLLDAGKTVPLNRAAGDGAVHRLLYSAPDEAWFVAVQDWADGTVATVLPLAYHRQTPERAVDAAKAEAKARAGVGGPVEYDVAVFARDSRGRRAWRSLCRWASDVQDPARLVADHQFVHRVSRLLSEEVAGSIERLSVRPRSHAVPHALSLAPFLAALASAT